jgi:hypothetical protein
MRIQPAGRNLLRKLRDLPPGMKRSGTHAAITTACRRTSGEEEKIHREVEKAE